MTRSAHKCWSLLHDLNNLFIRFPDESSAVVLRRWIRLLPYYFPPFLITNIINLLLLVRIIFLEKKTFV